MSATDIATTPDADAAESGAAEEGSGRGSRRLAAVVVAVLVLGALAAGAFVFLGGDGTAPPAAEAVVEEGAVVEVATMTVNLAGSPDRYARVGFAVVLAADADATVVTERGALLKDAALSEVGRFDAAQLTATGGLDALRSGLTARARELFPDGEVVRVVLTELLVQ